MREVKRECKNENKTIGRRCRNGAGDRGAALVLVLILTAIGLAFSVTLLYMVTTGTQMTGGQKRYDTALQAGKAGIDVIRQVIDARGNPGIPFPPAMGFSLPSLNVAGFDCLDEKLNNASHLPTGVVNWNGSCDPAININPAVVTSYDMTFNLGVAPNPIYNVYAKIVDTVDGNSGANTGLVKTGVVVTNSGEIPVQSLPYLYTIEVLAQNSVNPNERARLSMLHQF
ncbi:MAG: pilus assembly PilX N-terminal domain-containing protein [Planctomycetota bacterium]|jgi:hypothetical protein